MRDRWRKEDNVWKKQPFLVTHLPTVIKITEEGVSFPERERNFGLLILGIEVGETCGGGCF